ncbi:hypothetical protein D3C72_1848540 [compost metagenome]
MGAHESEVRAQRFFQHIAPAAEDACLLAFGQRGAIARGRVERPHAGAAGADALDHGALGHDFHDQAARLHSFADHIIARHAGVGTDDPADAAGGHQGEEACLARAGVVVDQGQVAHAGLGQQSGQQARGNARAAKAAHEDGGAGLHVAQGVLRIGACLVVHHSSSAAQAARP